MFKRKDVSKMAKKLTKEELELMSYNDIALMLLKENKEQTTLDLFKQIVQMLELSEKTLESKIGEFYTALTNDKRFILLESGKWDLKSNHKSVNLTVEDDLEDYEEEIDEDYDDVIEDDENEDDYSDEQEDDMSEVTEEYKNLVIVDEEDLEQN